MKSEMKPFHETVAEKLIDQLREGTAPWQKPWKPGEAGANMPINPTTGKRYKGINAIQLMSEGRDDQRWMTYKQAVAVDAQVRKGEKGTPIQYWKFTEDQNKTDALGNPILDGRGDPIKETVQLERPRVFFATVFNAEQIDNLPPLPRKEQVWNAVERAEQILQAAGATIHHSATDRAFYRAKTDSIHLPGKVQFPTADNYYATALHELGHWTGHETRLDRELVHPFGSEGYAKEELRAEIASMIMGDVLGIGHDPEQHAAYVGSWIKALEDDPLEIFRAAADAEKIQEYVMGLEQKQVQEQTPEAATNHNVAFQVKADLESLSRLPGIEQIAAGAKMTEEAVANPDYKLALQAELDKSRSEILVSGADLKRSKEETSAGDANQEHPYSGGFSAAQMALNRADQFLERQARLDAAPRGYVLRSYDDEGRHDEPQPDLAAAIIAFDERGDFSKVLHDGKEIIGAEPDPGDEVLIFDQEIKQVYNRVLALNVDFAATLANPGHSFSHLEAFQVGSFAAALHAHGLNTVHDVTGNDPAKFFDTALAKLSPVFGIAADHGEIDNAYLERQGLSQAFANLAEQLMIPLQLRRLATDMRTPHTVAAPAGAGRAEAWTLDRIEKDTLASALDGASHAQLERVDAVLAAMKPLSAENPFWQRNDLPSDLIALAEKIDGAQELVAVRQEDAIVAAARLDLVTGHAFGRERAGDAYAFDRVAEETFGFTLPQDWNGRVQVQGNITRKNDGEKIVLPAANEGVEPESWGIYAQLSDGTHQLLTDRSTERLADELAERLAVIDARSTVSEHEKAAKLARVNEERVRRNPDSTDEDIAAARDARKNAEFAATTNDEDLQRRIAFEERNRNTQTEESSKALITVPYKEKEEAKALGAKWDRKEQSWYVPLNLDPAPFVKWVRQPTKTPISEAQAPATAAGKSMASDAVEGRLYLAVPYADRNAARTAGAAWDKAAKSWYAGANLDLSHLAKWMPENVATQQGPAMSPREEFAEALKSVGCIISGEHPIMDGKTHRITVEGEKFTKNSGSGFYVGHLDGHPAAYVKNNKTGVDLTWKSKGYLLDPEQKALLAVEAAVKMQQREAELRKRQDQASRRVVKQMEKLVPIVLPTTYMQAKGIAPHAGAFTDSDGKKTYLPATDADGKQWSMQYIQEDGSKRFAKDSRKDGSFHVVGGMDELAKAPALVIGEGYATAAQLKQSLGYATVCAFDSGNLAMVALALHEKFPDKPVVIAGDDDRHLEMTQGVNPGRAKAEEAAKLVNGKVLLPIFAPDENSYPAELEPVTQEKYREHQKTGSVLSDEQLAAMSRMKQFTDFNDLANKSTLGQEGIDRQVHSLMDDVIEKHGLARIEQQRQERAQSQDEEAIRAEKPKSRRVPKVA